MEIKKYKINYFGFHYKNRFGWIRLFGRGIKWKDISIHELIFSERNGYTKGIQFGNWYICWLRET